jgi:hypothetical protein
VAEALPLIQRKDRPAGLTGTVTTLGTPFIDVLTPIARRIDFWRRATSRTGGVFYALFLALWTLWTLVQVFSALTSFIDYELFNIQPESMKQLIYRACAALSLLIALVAIGVFAFRRGSPSAEWRSYWRDLEISANLMPFILAISSPFDEAWQLLHHLLSVANPLDVGSGLFRYLRNFRRLYVRRSLEVQRIQGARSWSDLSWWVQIVAFIYSALLVGVAAIILYSLYVYAPTIGFNIEVATAEEWIVFTSLVGACFFLWFALLSAATFVLGQSLYSVLWSPLRWLATQMRSFGALPSEIVTYVVRRRAWGLLQEIAIGLEGYRFKRPIVAREPAYVAKQLYRYEDLPEGAAQRALAKRMSG